MRFIANVFWSVASVMVLLAIGYAVLRFFRSRGGALGSVASTISSAVQP